MLAKVQIIPLIAALNLGLFIAAMRLGARSRKEWFISFLKSSSLCVAVAFIIQHHAPSLSAVLLTASVLILILMPIITSCHLETQHRQLPKGEIVKEWIAFGLPTVAYTFLVARFNWQAISWDPYAMSRYKIDMNGSCTIACYAARMADGTLNLFERSFDGLIIAKVVSIALPVILLIGLVEFSNPISRRIALGSQRIGAIMAICLCGAAIAMSMISSMRWPVDHYLPYQQPLLYLGILVGAQYVWPKIYWKSLAAYTLISLALINFRYPPLALKTFVKYQPAQLSRRILINGTIYDNEPICWRQHAGPEWKQSILGRACNWH